MAFLGRSFGKVPKDQSSRETTSCAHMKPEKVEVVTIPRGHDMYVQYTYNYYGMCIELLPRLSQPNDELFSHATFRASTEMLGPRSSERHDLGRSDWRFQSSKLRCFSYNELPQKSRNDDFKQ